MNDPDDLKDFIVPSSDLVSLRGKVNGVNGVNEVNGMNRGNRLDTIDAITLFNKEFPEIEFVVDSLLTMGLTIVGGRPKCGKSWLALNLAIAVADGGYALGKYSTNAANVLYLAMEDNERRLKKRLKMILGSEGMKPSSRLAFRTKWRRFHEGGFDDLRTYLTDNPDTRFVIIDTLQRVRGLPPRGGHDTYAGDYRELGELQAIALEFKVAILVVHHTTKMRYPDPFDSLSGTSGISGSADTLYVLQREPTGTVTLHVRGRDIEDAEIALRFDSTSGVWTALGNATEARLSEQRRKILEAVRERPLTPKKIAERTGLPHDSVKHLCPKMAIDGILVNDGGKYSPAPSPYSLPSSDSLQSPDVIPNNQLVAKNIISKE